MKTLRQLLALLQMSLRGIPQRLGICAVLLIGTTCVVAVLVAMLSMGSGVAQTNRQSARSDRIIVTSKDAQSLMASNLERSAASTIADTPGVRKDAAGRPLAAPVAVVLTEVRRRADDARTNVPLLGVDAEYWNVYPELHVVAGRMFQPALYELMVSQSRYELYRGLEIGDKLHLRGVDWTIVGRFAGSGDATQGLIGDIDTVRTVFKSSNVQMVSAVLDSPRQFEAFRGVLRGNPTMDVDVRHELDVLQDATKGLTGVMNFVSYFVGVIMAVGATLGAVNVMYALVDGRRREIATLRAIGFGTLPILLSVLLESLLFALPGAVLGVLIAWLFFSGDAVSPFGISFHLAVTPSLALLGITWAVIMGLLGGITPAIRATRVSVATALRGI